MTYIIFFWLCVTISLQFEKYSGSLLTMTATCNFIWGEL